MPHGITQCYLPPGRGDILVCVCACVRACVRACVCDTDDQPQPDELTTDVTPSADDNDDEAGDEGAEARGGSGGARDASAWARARRERYRATREW